MHGQYARIRAAPYVHFEVSEFTISGQVVNVYGKLGEPGEGKTYQNGGFGIVNAFYPF